MVDIKKREEKMGSKVKNNEFRDFVKDVTSRCSMMFYKNDGIVSLCRTSDRVGSIITLEKFNEERDGFLKFGQDFDFSKSFFENFQILMKSMPWPARISYMTNENCDYADMIAGVKNVYLSSNVTFGSENVCYSFSIKNNSRNIFNSVSVRNYCDNVYMSMGITNAYNVFYSKYISNCSHVWFSSNLFGCKECLFCDNLENKSYCIYNKQYDVTQYHLEQEKIFLQKDAFMKRYKNIPGTGNNAGSGNISGGAIMQSENIQNGYFVHQIKNGKNLVMVGGKDACEEMYNCFQCASKKENYNYGAMASGRGDHLVTNYSVEGSYMYYNCLMEGCSYCLGCIGLKNKSFCIFNKEYSKDERYVLANKIFAQMDKDGTLGQFFPGTMNPFYFNDTAAYLIDDTFTKEEVTKQGYLRRDEEIKVDVPDGAEVVLTSPPAPLHDVARGEKPSLGNGEGGRRPGEEKKYLNDFQGFDPAKDGAGNGVWKIDPEILKKVIKDGKGNYYRIVKMEYDFLMKHGLPLPELHRLERIKLGFRFK